MAERTMSEEPQITARCSWQGKRGRCKRKATWVLYRDNVRIPLCEFHVLDWPDDDLCISDPATLERNALEAPTDES